MIAVERNTTMAKNMRRPNDGLVEPEGRRPLGIDGDDVEGHGLPLTAPPSIVSRRGLGHGGENIPTPVDDENDVEGHRIR